MARRRCVSVAKVDASKADGPTWEGAADVNEGAADMGIGNVAAGMGEGRLNLDEGASDANEGMSDVREGVADIDASRQSSDRHERGRGCSGHRRDQERR